MAVACWQTQSVFATHNLKAIHRVQDRIFSLGPVLVTGSIVPYHLLLCPTSSSTPNQFEDHGMDLLGDATTALSSVLPCVTSTHACYREVGCQDGYRREE
ncbi:hypothetical protein E2C01_042157 [Portunus trituberculatus]|uniref:Uncharacterized protein n=1 Tax=Portunus trituberculatus TaxID=210409 RepID=A0A5B7FSA5_PORTR|nr:hypothetical protein [Portunus trituberculatus]